MFRKINEYFTYRRNRKLAEREMARIAVLILPTVREVSRSGSEIVDFIRRLTKEAKNTPDEKLVEMVLQEISTALQLNYSRMIEILTYIAGLSPDEIQKILVHAMTETMPE